MVFAVGKTECSLQRMTKGSVFRVVLLPSMLVALAVGPGTLACTWQHLPF